MGKISLAVVQNLEITCGPPPPPPPNTHKKNTLPHRRYHPQCPVAIKAGLFMQDRNIFYRFSP